MQVGNLLHKWNVENDQVCKLPTSFQLVHLVVAAFSQHWSGDGEFKYCWLGAVYWRLYMDHVSVNLIVHWTLDSFFLSWQVIMWNLADLRQMVKMYIMHWDIDTNITNMIYRYIHKQIIPCYLGLTESMSNLNHLPTSNHRKHNSMYLTRLTLFTHKY